MAEIDERFTDEEWDLLMLLPFATFIYVAAIDGEIDDAELARFEEQIGAAEHYKDPLHRQLFLDASASDRSALLEEALERLVEVAQEAKGVLARRLTREEYHRFLSSLLSLTEGIATASGGGDQEASDGSSVKEQKAAAALVRMFEVDLDAGRQALGS